MIMSNILFSSSYFLTINSKRSMTRSLSTLIEQSKLFRNALENYKVKTLKAINVVGEKIESTSIDSNSEVFVKRRQDLENNLLKANDLTLKFDAIKWSDCDCDIHFDAIIDKCFLIGLKFNRKKIDVKQQPRKPFITFGSSDDIHILVGRNAEDNDKLSCDPKYRQDDYWWMHAYGHAGSHVVICYEGDDLCEAYPVTVKEAALLAANKSKANTKNVEITLTRCKYVIKPSNVNMGTVRLTGPLQRVLVSAQSDRSKKMLQSLDTRKIL